VGKSGAHLCDGQSEQPNFAAVAAPWLAADSGMRDRVAIALAALKRTGRR